MEDPLEKKIREALPRSQKFMESLLDFVIHDDALELVALTALRTLYPSNKYLDPFIEKPYLNIVFNLTVRHGSENQSARKDFSDADFFKTLFDYYANFYLWHIQGPSHGENREIVKTVKEHYLIQQVSAQIYDFQLEIQRKGIHDFFEADFKALLGFTAKNSIDIARSIGKMLQQRYMARGQEALKIFESTEEQDEGKREAAAILYMYKNVKELFKFSVSEVSSFTAINPEVIKRYMECMTVPMPFKGDEYKSPLGEDISLVKPGIKLMDGRYFLPCLPSLINRQKDIFEELLKEEKLKQSRLWIRYKDKRHSFALDVAYQALLKLFKPHQVFKNLYFKNGEINGESDILVCYDDKILICEVKAGAWSDQSRSGRIKKIETDLKNLVAEAFSQCLKVGNYINKAAEPVFKDEKGHQEFLKIKIKPKEIFYICLTLENLMSLAANLNNTNEINLFKSEELPLCVNVQEFEIMTQYLASPSIFFHYLKNRLKAQKDEIFRAYDELSYLSYYMKIGNFIARDKEGKEVQMAIIDPEWIKGFDDFYNGVGPRPQLHIHPKLLQIIKESEELNYLGHSTILSHLMNFGHQSLNQLFMHMETAERKTLADRKMHSVSIVPPFEKAGVAFFSTWGPLRYEDRMPDFCYLKKYQSKSDYWIGISKNVKDKKWTINEMLLLQEPWTLNQQMEIAVNKFQDHNFAKRNHAEKIGRNDLCPCNSGKKFKKCHGEPK